MTFLTFLCNTAWLIACLLKVITKNNYVDLVFLSRYETYVNGLIKLQLKFLSKQRPSFYHFLQLQHSY